MIEASRIVLRKFLSFWKEYTPAVSQLQSVRDAPLDVSVRLLRGVIDFVVIVDVVHDPFRRPDRLLSLHPGIPYGLHRTSLGLGLGLWRWPENVCLGIREGKPK